MWQSDVGFFEEACADGFLLPPKFGFGQRFCLSDIFWAYRSACNAQFSSLLLSDARVSADSEPNVMTRMCLPLPEYDTARL